MALRSMLPFQPPLPTMRNFPFHAVLPGAPSARGAGSHNSILMSESAVGLSVAATRQNAGRSANGLPPRPPGCENAPAPTASAAVIVACGSASEARLSHVAACAATALSAEHAIANPNTVTRRSMGYLFQGRSKDRQLRTENWQLR